jgi:hypothetical protein
MKSSNTESVPQSEPGSKRPDEAFSNLDARHEIYTATMTTAFCPKLTATAGGLS